MRCGRIEKRLGAYLDGALPQSRAAEVEGHLARCEACRRRLEALQGLQALLGGFTTPPVPEGFALRVVAQARRDSRRSSLANEPCPTMRLWLPVARATALAAAALLGLYVGLTSATARQQTDSALSANPGEKVSESLYAESFDLLPEGSPAAQYLVLLNEKGR